MSDARNKPSPIMRGAAVLEDWWASVCTAFGAVVLALLGLLDSERNQVDIPTHPSPVVVLVVGSVLTVAGLVGTQRRSRRLTDLVTDTERLRTEVRSGAAALKLMADIELDALNEHLRYFSSERLSLFVRSDGGFVLVTRYSKGPLYREQSQTVYEGNEGCRGRAWQSRVASVVIEEVARSEQWVQAHVGTGMTREAVDALRMPARTVVAIRIDDQREAHFPLGVLVIESNNTYRDLGAGGQRLTATLDPDVIVEEISASMPRLQGVLTVFAELNRSTPTSTDAGTSNASLAGA